MRKLIEDKEDGLISLLGEKVTLMCVNYFYTGILEGVNETCVKLKDPSIVYETGAWNEPRWKDIQALPNDIYVQISAIESFGILK